MSVEYVQSSCPDMRDVYLDHAATTPMDDRVLEDMMPYLKDQYGNASSVHALGRTARNAVESSRERVASLIGAAPGEIVFTSGGTEADNMALKGLIMSFPENRRGLVTSQAEHKAVLDPAHRLQQEGVPVTFLQPDRYGQITPDQVRDALDGPVGAVSLMHANNELGTLNPVREIADVCREHEVLLHSDAVQSAGIAGLDVEELGVDLLSLSGHKFYGPKGVGVLYVRGGIDLPPLVEGGSQERERRGGTENVAAIVGLTRALELSLNERESRWRHLETLKRRLIGGLREALGDAFVLNSPRSDGASDVASLPHIVNVAFPPEGSRAVDGEMLLLNLDMQGIYASNGSACTSGAVEPSHVLEAIGLDSATAKAAVRLSLGKDSTVEEVDYVVETLESIVHRLRA